MRRQITHEEILNTYAFALRAKMYKVMPGIVRKGGTAMVDVEPAVHDVRFDPDLGVRVSEPWPILPDVPVAWPKFGGFALVGTLAPGNKVILISFDLDPSLHRGTGNAEDPVDTSRHTGAYWVAYPADITDAGALSSPGAFAAFGDPLGVQVQVGASFVSVGAANATDFAALASKVATELGKIATALASLSVTTGAGSGGTVVAGTPYTPGSVASAVVKLAP